MADEEKITEFKTDRSKDIKKIYSGDRSFERDNDRSYSSPGNKPTNAAGVRRMLDQATQNKENITILSQHLYATNPIYSAVIDYLSNMFMWRYTVTPHKIYSKSKAKNKKKLKDEDFELQYNLMLETVEGLGIETKFPALLQLLFTQGAVYVTTYVDEDTQTVDTLLLPDNYCRKVAETQYGTSIIEFNFDYFKDLGLNDEKELKEFFKSFPKEFETLYKKAAKSNNKWLALDPRYSSGFMLNDLGLPTYFYILGGILDYEKYQDNELERSDNNLKYLVTMKMPVFQDKLVFEVPEVEAMHKSMRKIIDRGEKTKLLTTFGDVELLKLGDNSVAEADTLNKAFQAIFRNAGFNSGIFTSESVQALQMSLIRDKGMVWKYVQAFTNFYNLAINNYFDFKGYQADIDILPISPYTYRDDIEIYRNNATLGVGKLAYLVASGIKQKHVQDTFELESFLNLERITPMQTSYTQTAEDRSEDGDEESGDKEKSDKTKPENEPADDEKSDNDKKSEDSESV